MSKYILMFFFLIPMVMPTAHAETITISGSTTVKKFIMMAAESYEELNPNLSININGAGSSAGFGQILDKRVDIGMMSRELTTREQSTIGDIERIAVAVDAVAAVVSREVEHAGLVQLTVETLAGIYRGQITNWNQLGGPDRAILLVDKDLHRGTRHVFAEYVLGSPTAPVASDAIILESNDDVATIVASSDQAIAYLSAAYVDESVHALALEIDGEVISPSIDNIRSGAYPIFRKLYLLVPRASSEHVQGFIQFVMSVKGQKIAARAGYLPIQ